MERFFSSRSVPNGTRKGFVIGEALVACASRGNGIAESASCKKERRCIACILGLSGVKKREIVFHYNELYMCFHRSHLFIVGLISCATLTPTLPLFALRHAIPPILEAVRRR